MRKKQETRGKMEEIAKQIALFLEDLEVAKNASVHTLRNYSLDLAAFKEFLAKEKGQQLDKKLIRSYLGFLKYWISLKRGQSTRPSHSPLSFSEDADFCRK